MMVARLSLLVDGTERENRIVILRGALLSGNLPQIKKCVGAYQSLLEVAEGKYKSYQVITEVKEG